MMLLAKTRLRLRTSPKPFRALYDGCGRYSGKQASSSVSPEKWSGRGHNRAFSHFTGTQRARWQTVIRGTRLSVECVIGLMADGWSEADILRDYPGVTHDDIIACLAYARDTLSSEKVFPSAA